ncbi:MAG: hypothetical protein JWO42_3969 [Chloroflexi bacterium]|nr:hypothetical protein [Chloroflexota bacterium]
MYGSADPAEIARRVDTFCATYLGSPIDTYLFYESSQGGVSGVLLADGRRVIVKAHTPAWSADFLRAVHQVQRYLAAHAFPCARPLLEPTQLGHGYATVEELVGEGDAADAHLPAVRGAMAAALAKVVIGTRSLRGTPGLQSRMLTLLPPGALWPVPHSPIFDFATTTEGAEWIPRRLER